MGFIAAITGGSVIQGLVVYLVSDKAGSWISQILSERGIGGLGTKAVKAAAQSRLDKNAEKAREEKLAWLMTELETLKKEESK